MWRSRRDSRPASPSTSSTTSPETAPVTMPILASGRCSQYRWTCPTLAACCWYLAHDRISGRFSRGRSGITLQPSREYLTAASRSDILIAEEFITLTLLTTPPALVTAGRPAFSPGLASAPRRNSDSSYNSVRSRPILGRLLLLLPKPLFQSGHPKADTSAQLHGRNLPLPHPAI